MTMNAKTLSQIQTKLKAPKGNFNKFGGYNYRSCEDICEAVKPILAEYGVALTMSDEIVVLGDRFYVKATATLTDDTGGMSVTAYAREEESKKGMDGAQVTGSASSYARKYALNGLLCIDDTKDPDTMDNRPAQKTQPKAQATQKAQAQIPVCKNEKDLVNVLAQHGVNQQSFCQWYGIGSLQEMTEDRYQHFNGNAVAVINQLGGRA